MRHLITLFYILSLLLYHSIYAAKSSQSQTSKAENLFIIVMNGVRYNDTYGDKNHLYIENIWEKLRPLGTICTKFENRELTYPIPSQMSLLTGVWHIFKNPHSKTISPAVPTLFEYWNKNAKKPENTSYFASFHASFDILTHSNHRDFGKTYEPVFESRATDDDANGNAIYENVLPYIQEKRPSFVYLSLGSPGSGSEQDSHHSDSSCQLPGQVDACGGGVLLNLYYESIILMDGIVYDLWDRIQKEKQYKNNTIFIVLSSFGRHTNDFHGFGDKCRGCTHLYLLAVGPGIKKNFVSKRKRSLIDICRTIGHYFDIPTPYAKGKIMKELFEK